MISKVVEVKGSTPDSLGGVFPYVAGGFPERAEHLVVIGDIRSIYALVRQVCPNCPAVFGQREVSTRCVCVVTGMDEGTAVGLYCRPDPNQTGSNRVCSGLFDGR